MHSIVLRSYVIVSLIQRSGAKDLNLEYLICRRHFNP